MFHIMVGFQAEDPYGIDGRQVTARGLHGLLYHVLQQTDPAEAGWLHSHASPKPYSLSPYYTQDGRLAGLRLAVVLERAATLIIRSWQQAYQTQMALSLGRQRFCVRGVEYVPGATFADLAGSPAATEVSLRFLSPTTFRQGPGTMPLPLPRNVFHWPHQVWEAFAPGALALPVNWPTWCERYLFVEAHKIETVQVALDTRVRFTGFVGDVHFKAYDRAADYLSAWQALSSLAAFCGVGYKTTMGMGAVERLS